MQASTPARPPGRPRAGVNEQVFAATLNTVAQFGYAAATVERIAAAAGIAKTTVYRRWPTKGALIIDCLLDAFGPAPHVDGDRAAILAEFVRWAAAKISDPGVGDAFAGVFSDAVSDPALREILASRFQEPYRLALREILASRFQEPYRLALREALDEPDDRVLFFIDVVVGTLLHRMGMTGEPMVDADVRALTEMVLRHFAADAA